MNSEDFVRHALELRPDLGVSISYNQILRRPILDSARLGIVNFHAGKLPRYRGRNVINWAIINGESEIGLTAHFVDEGIDTGDIIYQITLPILWNDGYGDVLNRVVENFPHFASEVLDRIASGRFTAQPQTELPGTYFPGREDGDEWLDWSDTSLNLYNKIRAISRPGPGARTSLSHAEVIVWSAVYDESWPKYIATPGQVSGWSPGTPPLFFVRCRRNRAHVRNPPGASEQGWESTSSLRFMLCEIAFTLWRVFWNLLGKFMLQAHSSDRFAKALI